MLFSFVHGLVQPNFKVFQNDCPVVLFIYWQVKTLVKLLLSLIVKPFITEKSKTATDLKNIDLSSDESLRPIKKMLKWDFWVKKESKKLIRKIMLVLKTLESFARKVAQLIVHRSWICSIVSKLIEWSPVLFKWCDLVLFLTLLYFWLLINLH